MAFEGWLPDDFLWRKKAQFGDGSGAASVLQSRMEESITEEDFERERHEVEPPLHTREEVAYYRIFAEYSARSAPSAPSAASPRPSSPTSTPERRDQMSAAGLPLGTGALLERATSRTISRKACRFEEGSSRRQAATRSSEGAGFRKGLKITSYCR